MNFVRLIAFAGFLVGIAQPVNAADVAANISTARIEAIPIQTLTISDEQFLKGDAYGRPTTIAGTLRIAKGAGRLPLDGVGAWLRRSQSKPRRLGPAI
jgi:hypothetical protein